MAVVVRFVGSGDAFGSGGRLQTCIHVRTDASVFLIDCGASSLIGMKAGGLDPNEVETVFLTHLHGDHFGGLPFMILDGQISHRFRPITVAGPPGVRERVMATMEDLFPGSSTVRRGFALRFVELPAGVESVVGTLAVVPYEVVHESGAPAYALRISCDGRVIAYSGDTAWTDRLVEASAGADLFVCEALFFEKTVPYHLDYATLAGHRSALSCRRLVLTHMATDMLGHLAEIEVEHADDGMEFVL